MSKATLAKKMIAGLGLALMSLSASAAVSVGGINFADNSAFADSLISSTGSYTTAGGTLAQVLTDNNEGTYAFSFSNGAKVDLGFTNNFLVNGSGKDLALFELGVPDTFKVTINGITHSYTSAGTGFNAGGFALNSASIDLSDFGVAANAKLTHVVIGLDTPGGGGTVPSLSLVGAINTAPVPEPETYALMMAGLGLVGAAKRRRTQASAA